MLVRLAFVIMRELEVYAADVRSLNKILELDRQFETVAGLRSKVDRNHDVVCRKLDEPIITLREIRSIFSKPGLEPRSKKQLLSA
jgi:hypothetical protein